MSEAMKKPEQVTPESYSPKKPEIANLMKDLQFEKIVQTISYNGATIEVVERPEFIWVGIIDYAPGLEGEANIGKIIETYHEVMSIPKNEPLNPDWTAAISINYGLGGIKPLGWMMAQETATEDQDSHYGQYKVPASLYLRVLHNEKAAKALGQEACEVWELFGLLGQFICPEYGYEGNEYENGPQAFEYYGPDGAGYAYVPVKKI